MSELRFGTDGWRAVIADQFTFDNVARVADATARYWKRRFPDRRKIVVGYDRRFLSNAFAEETATVLAAHGFEVLLTDQATPTPAVSWAVPTQQAAGGVMITASHNPAAFNGFKLKTHEGAPADPAVCRNVEALLSEHAPHVPRPLAGSRDGIRRVNLKPAYYAAIKRQVDFKRIARSRLHLAHDALFGVGAGCFEELLRGTSCRVTSLNTTHDPNFGGLHPEPVPANYGPTSAWLRRHPHDLCLVTDGDADRIGGMDGRGGPLTTHQIACLLLYHLVVHRGQKGRVVKALTTTSMLDRMCEAFGLELIEVGVGFKYIAAEMLKGGVLLGAEESGGMGFPGHVPERDGLLAGLVLLELLAIEQVSVRQLLRRLERRFGSHHYGRLDLHLPREQIEAVMTFCREHPPARLGRSPVERMLTFDGIKYVARNHAWLMLRGSGTEPLLRIYAEGSSPTDADRLLKLGRRVVREATALRG